MGSSPQTSQPAVEQGVPLYLPSEAAAILRCSVWTIYQLADDGYLTDVRLGPKLRRCRKDEVDAMSAGTPLGVSPVPSHEATR